MSNYLGTLYIGAVSFVIESLSRTVVNSLSGLSSDIVKLLQEVGDDLSVCVLNILPKVSSLCDLMWPHVVHLIKGSCLGASYTKLAWCRYIFCSWRYVFYLSCNSTRPVRWNSMQFLAVCHHFENFGDHRYSDS